MGLCKKILFMALLSGTVHATNALAEQNEPSASEPNLDTATEETIVAPEVSSKPEEVIETVDSVSEDTSGDLQNEVDSSVDAEIVEQEEAPVDVAETPQLEEGEASALSVEELKKKVIELNRDLFILEEDLLFPANTQFVAFLSIDTGRFLDVDVTKLKVNDEIVASHLYTERQLKALSRGGMQRLYVGNLKTGEHEVTVFIEGQGPDNRIYKKAATATINKDTDVKAIEIRVQDKSSDFQPHISINEW